MIGMMSNCIFSDRCLHFIGERLALLGKSGISGYQTEISSTVSVGFGKHIGWDKEPRMSWHHPKDGTKIRSVLRGSPNFHPTVVEGIQLTVSNAQKTVWP